MMKKSLTYFSMYMFILFAISSCKKEGCTYETATNFSKKAKKDNGSCEFESRISFWFNQSVSNTLISYGVTTLHIYVNNKAVGEIDVTDWKVGADCGGNNLTVINKYSGEDKNTCKYEGRSETGTLHFQGTFSAAPNECQSVELKW